MLANPFSRFYGERTGRYRTGVHTLIPVPSNAALSR